MGVIVEAQVKVDLAGLCREVTAAGTVRWRVRIEGNPKRKITIPVAPGHKEFDEAYHAARSGHVYVTSALPETKAVRNSLRWLSSMYMIDFERRVKAGMNSPLTLKKKRGLLDRLNKQFGDYDINVPPKKIIEIRDNMIETPASADSMIAAMRVLFQWAIERGYMESNPAQNIAKIDRGNGGTKPWTIEDLQKYRAKWGPGTMQYLCITLLLFTACRISDAIKLGRKDEFEADGQIWLGWKPSKTSSGYIEIPMAPKLYTATRQMTVQGQTYLLNKYGKPFSTPDSLGQMFVRWCHEAGLKNRSAHGVRKAVGNLLAADGCPEYEVMTALGHSSAQTSGIYTKNVRRRKLAASAMDRMRDIDW